MNILILNAVKGWSGIGSHSIELALALRKKGHNAIIGCSNEVNVKYHAEKFDLPIRDIRLKNLLDIRAILKIIAVMLKDDIEVIVANLGKEYWPATFVAKLLRRKIVIVRHQTNKLKKITNRLLALHTDKVIAVSNAVAEVLKDCGVPSEKIEVVHNAVNLDRFNPSEIDKNEVRKELRIGDDDIVVGTAGRLHSGKGGPELIHAVHSLIKEYPSIRLMFVGEGQSRPELEELSRSLSMNERVIFTGLRKDMERMYSAMDIFTLPSTCSEAFGMALIEAMAMEKPVIATSIGGVLDIINGENGILVPPRDSAAIARSIADLMNNKELSLRLALKGRKTVESRFSETAMGDGFERVFLKITGRPL